MSSTGPREVFEHIAGHMDVNAVVCSGGKPAERTLVQQQGSLNVKRVIFPKTDSWTSGSAESPYVIMDTQEVKTTWHPVGL